MINIKKRFIIKRYFLFKQKKKSLSDLRVHHFSVCRGKKKLSSFNTLFFDREKEKS